MITYDTYLGEVRISEDYFAKLIGNAVASCYGVSSMIPSKKQWVLSKVLRKELKDTGIKVRGNSRSVIVDLHISAAYGLNFNAISKSIIHKVTYVVEEATGITVERVIVHIDRMNVE